MRPDIDALRKAYAEDGAVLVKAALDACQLADTLKAYEWSLAHPGPGASRIKQASSATFYQDLWNPDCLAGYRDMLKSSPLPALVADVWGTPDVWFMYEQVFLKEGGESRRTPWHQDSSYLAVAGQERWPGKFGQLDKWSFCLKAARMPRTRRDHDETDAPEPLTGIQGEGGAGCAEGREDCGRAGADFRRSSQPDHDVEVAVARGRSRGLRARSVGRRFFAGDRFECAACEDRPADAGERFFGRCAHQGRLAERQAMIDRSHELPLAEQAKVLKLSRSSLYYRPRPVPAADLAIMRRIDELHLDYPFAGSRMLRDILNNEGIAIGRDHVATLMRRMGIEAIYRRANTSKPEPGHKIYPYLLRNLAIEKPNHVWAMDITYVPMARGFVYLAAVVDWFSRRVLSWRLSITMDVAFCLEAVEEALARHGRPEIFNTDQGSQFTSAAFTGLLTKNDIAISMDGRGSWRDNVFVERLWRSVKYEEVYLRAYGSVAEARASLGRYLDFYNRKRPHSSLDARTPDQAYFDHLPQPAAA
jgi:putative transposase